MTCLNEVGVMGFGLKMAGLV